MVFLVAVLTTVWGLVGAWVYGRGRKRTGILAEERHLEVVVDLEALVRIMALAKIGNRLGGVLEVQLLDRLLHEADTPAEEPGRGGQYYAKYVLGL
jgi:hypothetical protein